MKKFFQRYGVLILATLLCVALCYVMHLFGTAELIISILFSLALIACVVYGSNLFSGIVLSDIKLARFTRKLKKQLKEASTIYIMGHKFSDLDSVGASYGLYWALKDKHNVVMVANKQNTLARPLIDFLRFSDSECQIYDYDEIKNTVDESSLLIIVDTHRPVIVDFEELYNRADKVVVIDHHLRSADFVDKTVCKYMKSSASSTCEIVTHILRLMKIEQLSPVAASALFSGIMLDTKNFIMNTNPNTFKSAAFLRQNRADPVLIKKMFSESVEVCKRKYEIVSDVELFENFAIAKTESEDQYTRIATAQAADELLAINGVFASFVMCPSDGKINISARSFGDVNVQNIMARLGGGGHKTVAACQINEDDFDKVEKRLRTAIKEYITER